MEWTEQEKKIIEKAKFYKDNEIKAHVFVIPKPKFKNGLFLSDLQNGNYFWFLENNLSVPIRLFLMEIYDINDYIEEEKKEEENETKI